MKSVNIKLTQFSVLSIFIKSTRTTNLSKVYKLSKLSEECWISSYSGMCKMSNLSKITMIRLRYE